MEKFFTIAYRVVVIFLLVLLTTYTSVKIYSLNTLENKLRVEYGEIKEELQEVKKSLDTLKSIHPLKYHRKESK